MHGNRTSLSVALMLVLLVSTATAGPLSIDPNALPGWKGTVHFANTNNSVTMTADVDYAVYAPGMVETSAGLGNPGFAMDPSHGIAYVYAFEVYNTSPAVGGTKLLTFAAGLGSVSAVPASASMGHDATTLELGVAPSTNRTITVSANSSAAWSFTSPQLVVGAHSDILYFTWPAPPVWSTSGLQGVSGATIDHQALPSPEPSTVVLAMIAAICLLAGRQLHRRNRLQ